MPLTNSFNHAALIVMDVQPTYCAPVGWSNEEADKVAQRIASIVPEFRKVGAPVYVVYMDRDKRSIEHIKFHRFKPEETDIPVAKNNDSMIRGSNIKKLLGHNEHSRLMFVGFNHNACLFKSVMDALDDGFQVDVLEDLTGNEDINDPWGDDRENFSEIMAKNGANCTSSTTVLKAIKEQGTIFTAPKTKEIEDEGLLQSIRKTLNYFGLNL